MVCQDCKKREANMHLTQIVNNEKMTLALCHECAEARGFHSPLDNMPFPLAEILSGMVQETEGLEATSPANDLMCEKCELTFSQFTQQGRFGCGECYSAFRPRLESIMRKIHGASLHRGRKPELARLKGEDSTLPIKEEERIESDLRQAIDNEDFERAAELRDKLKAARQKLQTSQ